MRLLEEIPANAALLKSLAGVHPGAPVLGPQEAAAYMNAGSHPDIVERVWDQIGASLPPEAAVCVLGAPALVAPSGAVVAVAYGTAYALRLLPAELALARAAGARTVMRWSGGDTTDIAAQFGPGWIFGFWDKREPEWIARSAAAALD